jgi:peptidoglycan/LPS O-acetylase OafA/YrhL
MLQLDGLRAVAFLLVFVHHSLNLSMLWVGVDLFFVLSGMLITGILLNRRRQPFYFRDFYYRRMLRIFPPYLATLIAVPFVLGFRWEGKWFWYYGYLSNYLSAFVGDVHSALDPMWSLAIEEQFYLVWPLVVFLLAARNLRRLCWALILIAPIVRVVLCQLTGDWEPGYFVTFSRMDLLAAGSLLAVEHRRDPEAFRRFSERGLWLAMVAGIVFLVLAALVPTFRRTGNSLLFNGLGYSLLVAIMTGTIAYFMLPRHNVLVRLLSLPPLVYLGTISYSLYLTHKILNHVLYMNGYRHWEIAGLGLIAAVLLSTISWYAMERPLQRFKGRYRRREQNGDAKAGLPKA